jgi:hypothetical protein
MGYAILYNNGSISDPVYTDSLMTTGSYLPVPNYNNKSPTPAQPMLGKSLHRIKFALTY